MKAVIWTNYGGPEVLELREIPKPTPKSNEVLIKIVATTVTAGDCEMRRMDTAMHYRIPMRMYVGLRKPTRITILGMELAGIVESIGNDVTKFKPGDEVFAATGFSKTGTYAEYICLPEESQDEGVIAIKPTNMTFEEATPVPVGGIEALNFVRQGNIQEGFEVLINGAGGTIGGYAVQLAKYYGANVTAVDSTPKLDMLRSIGADRVIDFTQEDFTQSGQTYDYIIDVVSKGQLSDCVNSLTEDGHYLIANPGFSQNVRGRNSEKVIFGSVKPKTEDLHLLRELVEKEKLTSVVDRCYPLEQTAEAHHYVDTGRKTGNVVITVVQ
ncbi:MAG: NAD(P)-dependent alcohol dehydrogenase [Candidatus Thorarchaeota archaeon]